VQKNKKINPKCRSLKIIFMESNLRMRTIKSKQDKADKVRVSVCVCVCVCVTKSTEMSEEMTTTHFVMRSFF
jgi:hypothetical protein